jgi:hypothetical protein
MAGNVHSSRSGSLAAGWLNCHQLFQHSEPGSKGKDAVGNLGFVAAASPTETIGPFSRWAP